MYFVVEAVVFHFCLVEHVLFHCSNPGHIIKIAVFYEIYETDWVELQEFYKRWIFVSDIFHAFLVYLQPAVKTLGVCQIYTLAVAVRASNALNAFWVLPFEIAVVTSVT
jgi:hypothetical protein